MQIVCNSLFTKGVQMSTICMDTCLETLSALKCSVSDVLSEIDHIAINRSFSSLRIVNEQKVKC